MSSLSLILHTDIGQPPNCLKCSYKSPDEVKYQERVAEMGICC